MHFPKGRKPESKRWRTRKPSAASSRPSGRPAAASPSSAPASSRTTSPSPATARGAPTTASWPTRWATSWARSRWMSPRSSWSWGGRGIRIRSWGRGRRRGIRQMFDIEILPCGNSIWNIHQVLLSQIWHNYLLMKIAKMNDWFWRFFSNVHNKFTLGHAFSFSSCFALLI